MTVQKGNQAMTTSGDSSGQARREEGFPVGYYYLQRAELSMLLKMGADHIVNTVVERALKDSLVMEWGGPAGNLRNRRQNPGRVAQPDAPVPHRRRVPLIEQDVLLLSGGRRPLRSAAPVLRPDPPADRAFVHQTRTGTRAHPDR